MNYEDMSDGEINWKVHYAFNDIPEGNAAIMIQDYCNNLSDAWNIIVENEIDIIHNGMGCAVATDNSVDLIGHKDCIFSQHENPLRAAMICFLKIKDSENDTKTIHQ